jgi:small subunit ribosomal protein S13
LVLTGLQGSNPCPGVTTNGLIRAYANLRKIHWAIQMPEEFKHIVRIAGKDLAGDNHVQLALSDIKGVSVALARAVAYAAEIDPVVKLGDLNAEQIRKLENVLKNPGDHGIPVWMLNRRKDYESGKDMHLLGADIDMAVRSDIGRERRIRSRRGIRHELGLPVRGQRTRTTGRKGLTVGIKRKDIRMREEAAKAEKGRKGKEKEKE